MTDSGSRIQDTPPSAEDGPSNDGSEEGLLSEILYCIASFQAIVTPVSITMILSALAVVNINTDATRAQGEAAYAQTYEVLDLEEGNSSQNFAASLVNVSIMVSVICLMTFVIVVLYKYGCMKIFMGYMVLVTTMLLGYFTSNMAVVAIQKYEIRFDKFSFAYLIWNYAIVGVMAIFFNRGIPKFVTQGYLVTSSVVVAWQLSYLNDWTAWTLLVMLALYDLFAVLSPCGPLKALTQLMSRPGAQPLPGLLYEANLPTGVQRPSRPPADPSNHEDHPDHASPENSGTNGRHSSAHQSYDQVDTATDASEATMDQNSSFFINERLPEDEQGESSIISPSRASSRNEQSEQLSRQQTANRSSVESTRILTRESSQRVTLASTQTSLSASANATPTNQGKIPLALAKLYKLAVIDDDGVLRQRGQLEQREYSPEQITEREWTPRQLRAEVTAIFPERGGRIVAAEEQHHSEGKKYLVYNRVGDILRTFVVNRQGIVMQVVRREIDPSKEDNSIKLGLVSAS